MADPNQQARPEREGTAESSAKSHAPRKRIQAATAADVAEANSRRNLLTQSDETIGRLLGDARQKAGFSQAYAARQMGWPQSRVANIELGRRRLLFIEALLFADLYLVPVSTFDPRDAIHVPRTGRRPRTDMQRSEAEPGE